jgi:NAD(P)-dependent dehydrogenase (short-subunit alcohol dehydrogenase family)
VAITGRNAKKLASVAERIPDLRTFECEITDHASVRKTLSALDHIDHLVVLAGSSSGGRILDTPPDALRFVVEERIWGSVYAVQAAVPKMQRGSVTLTSGLLSGRPPENGAVILVAALAGVEGLAHYQRVSRALPIGRVAEPREAAHAILFALTNEYLTGEVLHVDGGARLV